MTIAEFLDGPETALNARITEIANEWPTLKQAIGCENCGGISRTADNRRCRHCKSEAIFDAAALLNREKT